MSLHDCRYLAFFDADRRQTSMSVVVRGDNSRERAQGDLDPSTVGRICSNHGAALLIAPGQPLIAAVGWEKAIPRRKTVDTRGCECELKQDYASQRCRLDSRHIALQRESHD